MPFSTRCKRVLCLERVQQQLQPLLMSNKQLVEAEPDGGLTVGTPRHRLLALTTAAMHVTNVATVTTSNHVM
jgi:hypothetical protein